MKINFPKGFFEGRAAIQCGDKALDIWTAACEAQDKPAHVRQEWLERALERAGDQLCIRWNYGSEWDKLDYFLDNGYQIYQLEDCLLQPEHHIDECFLDLL